MSGARPTTAPSGKPFESDFAMHTRSGSSPAAGLANMAPVRPKPVWISSATSTMPCCRQSRPSSSRNARGGTTKPPSPITGSITAQASDAGFTLLARNRASSAMPRATNASSESSRGRRSGSGIGKR